MNQQQNLKCKWSLWTNYAHDDKQRQIDYAANLVKLLDFESLEQLAYIWQTSRFRDYNLFFVNLDKHTVPKYTRQRFRFTTSDNGETKRIQALNYFRDPIEPTWQYGLNGHGGQFFIQVNRQDANRVCEAVMISVVGQLFPLANEIIGVRFVDRVNWATSTAQVRIEIWVKFCNQDVEKINLFGNDFSKFAAQIGWKLPSQIEFRNSK